MCKILVQNFIIKDILKKKNDVHWISVRTTIESNIRITVLLNLLISLQKKIKCSASLAFYFFPQLVKYIQ